MARKDRVREAIARFFDSRGPDWAVRGSGGGYAMDDDERPRARLLPVGEGRFEVQRWDRKRRRWKGYGPSGPCVLPLEDALDQINRSGL
jgi:hypothetical protein